MKLIDRLPFADRPHLITVSGEAVDVYRNQIIIGISIGDVLRPLPAILDTGHGHNLSIGEGQLKRWSGASLERIGELEIGHQRVVQYAAEVRLHRNVPGRAALRGDSDRDGYRPWHRHRIRCRALATRSTRQGR